MQSFGTQSPKQAVSDPTYATTHSSWVRNQSFWMRPNKTLDGLGVSCAFVLASKRAPVQHLDSGNSTTMGGDITRILTWLDGHGHYSELTHGWLWVSGTGGLVVNALKVLIGAILGSNPTARRFSLKSRLFSLSWFAHFWVDLGLLEVRTLFQKIPLQSANYDGLTLTWRSWSLLGIDGRLTVGQWAGSLVV